MMPYPRLDREEKLSCKLSCDDIEQIKKEYAKGHTIRNIASSFSVSWSTIQYWVDPLVRMRTIQRTGARTKFLWDNDPLYRKKQITHNTKKLKNYYQTRPTFHLWQNERQRRYWQKNYHTNPIFKAKAQERDRKRNRRDYFRERYNRNKNS